MPPKSENASTSPREKRHGSARKEVQKQPPRVAQHHDEGPQRTLSATDLELAEVRPVDLGLLARHRAQALEGIGVLLRQQPADDAPQAIGSAIDGRGATTLSSTPVCRGTRCTVV